MSLECVPSNPSPQLTHSEPDDLTETDAIRLAQEGDAGAFERIFRLYSPSCNYFGRFILFAANRPSRRGCIEYPSMSC